MPEIASCSPSTVRHKTSLIALVDPVKSTLGTHSFLSTPTNGDTAKILVWYIHTYTSSYLKITTLSLHIEYDCIWFVCFFCILFFLSFLKRGAPKHLHNTIIGEQKSLTQLVWIETLIKRKHNCRGVMDKNKSKTNKNPRKKTPPERCFRSASGLNWPVDIVGHFFIHFIHSCRC